MKDDDIENALNAAFLELLEKFRLEKTTQKQIAEQTGISPEYISQIKKGAKNAQFSHLAKLCTMRKLLIVYKKRKFYFLDEDFL